MDIAGFQALRAKPRTIIGVSLQVQAPTGEYEPDKLINAGTNRWAIKPAVGIIWPLRPTWLVELELGAWLIEDNDRYLGVTREQDPILSSEFHLIKRFRPGFWAAFDLNYYAGGRSTLDGIEKNDRQQNSRIGGTFLVPLKRHHALKGSYSTALTTQNGGDFETWSLSYLYSW